jgi:hypothetical protein
MQALSPFTGLEQPTNLVHFGTDRSGKPAPSQKVVNPAQGAMAEVELLNVTDLRAPIDFRNLKPGVQAAGHAMLDNNVNTGWAPPDVPRYHGALESAEEFAVLSRNHAVRKVRQFRHPDHFRVGLDVLGRIQDEVKGFVLADAMRDGRTFTSNHDPSPDSAVTL